MVKKSVFKEGSGSRKGFVSEFQDELVPKDISSNNISKVKNKLINKSSENMSELLDNCVSLTITSPPYNIGKLSDVEMSDEEYWAMIENCFREYIELQNLEVD